MLGLQRRKIFLEDTGKNLLESEEVKKAFLGV
jgi:hypothetical protein